MNYYLKNNIKQKKKTKNLQIFVHQSYQNSLVTILNFLIKKKYRQKITKFIMKTRSSLNIIK